MIMDLLRVYAEQTVNCQIAYKHPDGTSTTLSYDELIESMFAMSFDPYNCPALRWGAAARKSGELTKDHCKDDQSKFDWYSAEQSLRNQIDRTYDSKMGWSLSQLQQPNSKIGASQAPEINIKKFLETAQP